MPQDAPQQRIIRSFVIRSRRATSSQNRAIEQLWPRFGIEAASTPIRFEEIFGRAAPLVLEVGFGNGDSLAEMARDRPDEDFIGIDVHRPGVGHLLLQIDRLALTNIRVICGDAVRFMEQEIDDASLNRIQLFFPDPWPKRKHHKRRIVQSEWISMAARKLQPGGIFHMATDWEDYAVHMRRVTDAEPLLRRVREDNNDLDSEYRPETRFERRGRRLGHGVWDLIYRREERS